jgi:hypothetical protein
MKAIGLDLHTRGLVGLHLTTTANGSLWVTGKEIADVLNTITTGTASASEIMGRTTIDTAITTVIDTVITTTTETKDSGVRVAYPSLGGGRRWQTKSEWPRHLVPALQNSKSA